MNVIGYVRISSEGQLDGFGLDTQEKAIRSWTKNNNHRFIGLYSDIGVSGATDAVDRPGLSEALAALADHQAGGLVIARLDRLARALTVQEATLAIAWRAGAEVFAADSGKVLADDPDDPARTAIRQVMGIFAELDRRMTVKRLRDGRATKAATGRKAVGSYAYGYGPEGKGRERDAGAIPDEQAAIAVARAARERGLSFRQIAAQLDATGYLPRRAASWSPMSVRAIINRDVL